MDAKHSADMFKHLEKQSEVLMESYRAMSHELHRLQVEEEMLMHKLYEVMSAEGLIKKKEKGKDSRPVDMQKEKEDDSDAEETSSSQEDSRQVDMQEEKEEDSDEEETQEQF